MMESYGSVRVLSNVQLTFSSTVPITPTAILLTTVESCWGELPVIRPNREAIIFARLELVDNANSGPRTPSFVPRAPGPASETWEARNPSPLTAVPEARTLRPWKCT